MAYFNCAIENLSAKMNVQEPGTEIDYCKTKQLITKHNKK